MYVAYWCEASERWDSSGLDLELRSRKIRFVDLNRDELFAVPTKATYTGLDHL